MKINFPNLSKSFYKIV